MQLHMQLYMHWLCPRVLCHAWQCPRVRDANANNLLSSGLREEATLGEEEKMLDVRGGENDYN